jgi:hypothetical protein
MPAQPEPDAKDWTWVISAPCPDCGFDAAAVDRRTVPDLARRYGRTIGVALERPDAATRPAATVWSPLEYGCHVRDVCTLFAHRLHLMLTEDDPLFENWDQDETAIAERYWEQQPATVAEQLEQTVERIAAAFAAVADDQWRRPGRRSNGSLFTVDTFARYFLHDLAHHAREVTRTDDTKAEPSSPHPARQW